MNSSIVNRGTPSNFRRMKMKELFVSPTLRSSGQKGKFSYQTFDEIPLDTEMSKREFTEAMRKRKGYQFISYQVLIVFFFLFFFCLSSLQHSCDSRAKSNEAVPPETESEEVLSATRKRKGYQFISCQVLIVFLFFFCLSSLQHSCDSRAKSNEADATEAETDERNSTQAISRCA